jgi:hypothetical protein
MTASAPTPSWLAPPRAAVPAPVELPPDIAPPAAPDEDDAEAGELESQAAFERLYNTAATRVVNP